MVEKIANEIILASIELKTNQVSKIAEGLGYQPILIMNALFAGEKAGKFVFVKKKDIIKISGDVVTEELAITEGLSQSQEQVEEFIANENSIEVDLTFEELHTFIPNLPDLLLHIAINSSKKLATYDITDPKDKESTYQLITLKENLDKRFGQKQFDETKPSKFAKAGKK